MVITEWSDYRGEWKRIFSFDLWRSGGVYYCRFSDRAFGKRD